MVSFGFVGSSARRYAEMSGSSHSGSFALQPQSLPNASVVTYRMMKFESAAAGLATISVVAPARMTAPSAVDNLPCFFMQFLLARAAKAATKKMGKLKQKYYPTANLIFS